MAPNREESGAAGLEAGAPARGEAGPGTMTASVEAGPRLAPAPTPPLPGPEGLPALPEAVTGRYEILTLLGRGGMGAVYRARDRRLGREVALKLLFSGDGERLLREARAQARVEHEHACKIHEVGAEGGASYIAMQLVDGEPLDKLSAKLTVEEKARILRQVALALHEAHRLGLVHRDVKPSNILVERREDGALHPYLTDFGIAREAGEEGLTATGAIAGTPAFMAPEQARGEVRALDRRTDVYGLGATAFVLLGGRPPFEEPKPWELLPRIIAEDAPPLRRFAPELPADLEAIVARCLEKEPARRYPSARSLADDLQRFLDGEPVEARRLSRGLLLLRWARRRRAAVTLAAVALFAALLAAALWAEDRQRAAQRAELARELSEDVKEMELFLRTAYALPLHDVERERDTVRERLRGIETRMAAAGAAGAGPGHHALGRGYLALHEPERALAELQAAATAGYASPELDYALGLALGELYDRAVVLARRIDDDGQRRARLEALASEFAEPASRHLKAALAARLSSPAYVEGLIALREGRPEEALAKAEAAFAKAPWLYEARLLQGDARFALGSRFGHDAAFDYDRMMTDYRAAAEDYRAAADIARSDPRVHEAECRLWAQMMYASTARRDTLRSSHAEAVAACGRAIMASSRSAEARLDRAFLQASHAWLSATGKTDDKDPQPAIDDAISLATEAARRAPDEPLAPYVVGLASDTLAHHQNSLGLDSREAIGRAIAGYEGALRVDPQFLWALRDLASAYLQQAEAERFRGLDPISSLERTVELSERTAALDPRGLLSWSNQSAALLIEAEHLAGTGRNPSRTLARVRAAIETGRALAPDWPMAGYLAAYACWIEASYELLAGGNPTGALERGGAFVREAAQRSPGTPELLEVQGKLAAARAQGQLERGEDPSAAIDEARAAFQQYLAGWPWDTGIRVWRARVEVLGLRWLASRREVTATRVAAAAAPILELLVKSRIDPRPAQVLAELWSVQALSQADRGKPADEALRTGLRYAEEALALNPHMPAALAVQGELLLAQARVARSASERHQLAHAAAQALAAAVRENPLMERRLAALLRTATELGRE
ncbi:serine/threonine protein kinase [Pyxidicoccus parkwayensis]|uniref:Serine/threonine protein kinase n=1 Tax=Pyxidicoccus parkwayensis TaxID=2813578 RepID=A0ABX7P9N5_9BACT|nr:serine/threonine-protein kinase [Pyxidicoccus parkwaysis]QSQ27132.1 serine/threonine protein kinase [Pyxidicoccus parkwaysis]